MKQVKLTIRCYGEQKDNQWQVFCLDFCLAAQAGTFEEARVKLEGMIHEYVYDATEGEDSEHAEYLLSRRAPIGIWAKYYLVKARIKLHLARNGMQQIFKEKLPVKPYPNCGAV